MSFVGSSDIGWFFPDQYLGTDPDRVAAQSAAGAPPAITTPTLVIHSEEDWRCPVEQGARLYVELKRRGVPTELLLFPGEGHELSRSGRPRHRQARLEHVLRWWARGCRPRENAGAARAAGGVVERSCPARRAADGAGRSAAVIRTARRRPGARRHRAADGARGVPQRAVRALHRAGRRPGPAAGPAPGVLRELRLALLGGDALGAAPAAAAGARRGARRGGPGRVRRALDRRGDRGRGGPRGRAPRLGAPLRLGVGADPGRGGCLLGGGAGRPGRVRRWAAALQPLADHFLGAFARWLPAATYPVRGAAPVERLRPAHGPAGRPAGEHGGRATDAALRWFADDTDAPVRWEPSGSDFLSPSLVEAVLMTTVLPEPEPWLTRFLPRPRFTPAVVSDASDGQTAHLHGLNLSRAWCLRRLAAVWPAARDELLATATEHAAWRCRRSAAATTWSSTGWPPTRCSTWTRSTDWGRVGGVVERRVPRWSEFAELVRPRRLPGTPSTGGWPGRRRRRPARDRPADGAARRLRLHRRRRRRRRSSLRRSREAFDGSSSGRACCATSRRSTPRRRARRARRPCRWPSRRPASPG